LLYIRTESNIPHRIFARRQQEKKQKKQRQPAAAAKTNVVSCNAATIRLYKVLLNNLILIKSVFLT